MKKLFAGSLLLIMTLLPSTTGAMEINWFPRTVCEAVTLTWSTTHATSVSIQPDIRAVPPSGSLQVSPARNTTYILTASGPGGTISASATVTVTSQGALQITSPYENDWIERPDATVEGTFANPTGKETGIAVNGILTLVHGNRFVVNHVPLQEGPNTITAKAVDADGRITETSIVVNCRTNGNFIRIDAVPASGTSVFETTLTVDGSFEFANALLKSSYLDQEVALGANPASCKVQISDPGLYFFTAEAQDETGRLHSDTIAALVNDRSQLDALLQGKWNAMKAKLLAGDAAGALNYYSITSRDEYEAIFTALGEKLPQVAADMRGIEMIYATEGFAKYRIKRSEVLQGNSFDITYYIYFVCDEKGVWTIQRY